MTPSRTVRPVALLGAFLLGFSGAQPASAKDPVRTNVDPRWSLIHVLENAEPSNEPIHVTEYGSLVQRAVLPPTNSPDIAIKPSGNVTQSENSVFIHPTNSNLVFVGNNATDFPVTQVFGTGVYWSTNGGTTWVGNDQGPGGVGNNGDPSVIIRRSDSRFAVGYISGTGGMGVSYSTDTGGTWTHRTVSAAGGLDKNHLEVDNIPTSPHYGNLYNTWSNLGGGANDGKIEFSRSTDGGFTWSAPLNISAAVASGSHDQGCVTRVAPNGHVYVAWAIYDAFPAEEIAIGFARSTDGGATFAPATRSITNIKGHRNTALPNTSIRRNSFPSMAVDVSGGPNNGAIYVAWTNQGTPGVNVGDTNIYIAKSTNGGTSFGTAVKANQDGGTNSQWFPWVACDPITGQVAVSFYDRRDDGSNTQCRVYMAVSNDGGATYEDFPVSDVGVTPVPIPGLAGGYWGDYIGLSFVSGRAMPTWSDNRTSNMLCYVSPILVADPTDPNAPTNVTAFSDYTTPTSVALAWTDPTTTVNGGPLPNFSIDILRDNVFLTNVNQGIGLFNDGGRTDGQLYQYTLKTRDDVTDSLSVAVNVQAFAGGSPTPAPPENAGVTGDQTSATVTWTNPTTQSDGTTLDDFAGVRIYRNNVFLIELARAESDTGSADQYIDNPPADFLYEYEISAIDNEAPVNESAQVSAGEVFVGDIPNILVYAPSDVTSGAVTEIFDTLQLLGESVFLTDDLFEFSPDLNAHEIIFVAAGIFSDNHIINATEGAALDEFAQDGGRVYIECSDCFNYDPESAGGYNIRPIFGLNDGPDGSADLFDVTGLNDLAGFQFEYTGGNNFMDELQALTSTPIHKNTANTDIVGVFKAGYGAGAGRGIASSFEFGGLVDVPSSIVMAPATHDVSSRVWADGIQGDMLAEGLNPWKERLRELDRANRELQPIQKRFANIGAPKANRATKIPGGMAGALQALRAANTKYDLMAAYLQLFRATGDPVLSTSTALVTSTVFQGDSDSQQFSITNPGTLNSPLNFSIVESPLSPWLDVTPAAGSIPANGLQVITVDLDAAALTPGQYLAQLIISSNDPVNPSDTVNIEFNVEGVPVVEVAPDPIEVFLAPLSTETSTVTVSNTGNGDLDYTLEAYATGGQQRIEFASQAFSQNFGNLHRGNIYRADISTPVREIEMRLNAAAATAMEFFVYENTAATGTFTKIFSVGATSGTGLGWYSSGPINVNLQAGKFYYIGAGWLGAIQFFSNFGSSPPLPFAVPFGAAMGPAGLGGYPPPATVGVGGGSFLYSMAIEVGDLFDVQILDPISGTVPAFSSTDVDVEYNSTADEGVFTGFFVVDSNDPNTATLQTPITVTVDGAVDAPVVAPMPEKLALHSNNPNPFFGATQIRFDLPRAGKVALRIFDVSGRLVRTLVNGPQEAGYRAVTWDGLDEGGQRATAGVYFYALDTEEKSFQRKMIQLR